MMPRSDRRTQFDPATTGLDLDHWDPVDECLVDRRSTLSQALHIGSRRGNHLWFTTENGRSFQARRILRQVAGSSGRHRADVRHCPQVAVGADSPSRPRAGTGDRLLSAPSAEASAASTNLPRPPHAASCPQFSGRHEATCSAHFGSLRWRTVVDLCCVVNARRKRVSKTGTTTARSSTRLTQT